MPDNLLDNALLFQFRKRLSGQRPIYLQAINENRDGDQTVCLDILVESVLDGLIGDNGVLSLVLD